MIIIWMFGGGLLVSVGSKVIGGDKVRKGVLREVELSMKENCWWEV
jgi:hypothetical protein